MGKKETKEIQEQDIIQEKKEYTLFKTKNIKDIIAPSGIDASKLNHLEIISHTNRLARSFFVSTLPRMGTFPSLLRDMYAYGDAREYARENIVNTAVQHTLSQRELISEEMYYDGIGEVVADPA